MFSLTLVFFRESDADWDKELAEDVKGECEVKYGPVDRIKVERESQVKLMLLPQSSSAKQYLGGDLLEVWQRRCRPKVRAGSKWAVVWRQTSLSGLHLRRHHAGSSVKNQFH